MSGTPTRFVAIVPAAGRAERMGRDKLLLPWGDTVVVGAVIDALRAGGADPVVLVAAVGNEALARWAKGRAVVLATNPEPERGMLSSVCEGLEALGGVGDLIERRRGVLVCPGDQPALRAMTVRAVAAALTEGAALAVPVVAGRRGHPLGIAPHLLSEIARLDRQVGLRDLLARHPVDEVEVDDPGAVSDIDRPADYERALARRFSEPSGA